MSGGYGVFRSRIDDLGTWTKISETKINTWNFTNRSEYNRKVAFLDSLNNLNIMDIDSYEIRQVSIFFN